MFGTKLAWLLKAVKEIIRKPEAEAEKLNRLPWLCSAARAPLPGAGWEGAVTMLSYAAPREMWPGEGGGEGWGGEGKRGRPGGREDGNTCGVRLPRHSHSLSTAL